MGFLDSLFESESETKTESRRQPWQIAAPGLTSATNLITDWLGQPQQFFPGQTYAPQSAAGLEAIEQLKTAAGAYPDMLGGFMGPATGAYNYALGAPQSVLDMNLQDVTQNPALRGAAEAIETQVNRNLAENILPQLKLDESLYGSQDVGRGIAARGTSDVLAENLAKMYGGAWAQGLGAETSRYGQALSAQRGAMGMTPALTGLGLEGLVRPAALLTEAGARERTEAQRAIDEEMARFQFAQTEPYTRGTAGLGALMGPAQAFGTATEESKTSSTPSPFQQIGGLAYGVGTLGGAFGLGGTGALAGGLGSGTLAPNAASVYPSLANINPYAARQGYLNYPGVGVPFA